MTALIIQSLASAGHALAAAIIVLIVPMVVFVALALLLKGRAALEAFERAYDDIRMNLTLHFVDAVFVAPLLAVLAQIIQQTVSGVGLFVFAPSRWQELPQLVTLLAVVFAGDFISYWRHRLEHTPLLWPSHAVHHSDAHMTWLTLMRFHPINRLTTLVVDLGVLAVLGFPEWALVANFLFRHWYGEFIHADLPWMYGSLRRVFVSPVMHRWHHARDVDGSGSNFATVFSIFDVVFGTFYVPGLCAVPLGVNDDMGRGTLGQMLYPLLVWSERVRRPRPRQGRVGRDVEHV